MNKQFIDGVLEALIIKLEENLHRRAIIVYFSRIDHVCFNLDFSSVHVLEWCKAGLRRLRKNKYAFTLS